MFRTFVAKILTSLLTLGVVFITSRGLGPEKYGTIGLLLVAVSMSQLFASLLGGTSLVYYTSRQDTKVLFSLSFIWSLLMSVAVSVIMAVFKLYPPEFFLLLLLVCIVSNVSNITLYFILGRERIYQHNIITVVQVGIHLILIIIFFNILKQGEIRYYLISALLSYTVSALAGLIFCRKDIFPLTFSRFRIVSKEIYKYGFWVQVSALIQIFNYRLSYFLVDFFLGRHFLGIYTLAVQLAEGFWMLPRSLALVQFSHISGMDDKDKSFGFTLKLFQLSVLFVFICSVPFFFIPEAWLLSIFGQSYSGIKTVLLILIPAIVVFSGVIILSHYFSGIGKVYYNTIAGLTGLVFTVGACLITIPLFGLPGAALSANFCYISMLFVAGYIFLQLNKVGIGTFFRFEFRLNEIRNVLMNLKSKS